MCVCSCVRSRVACHTHCKHMSPVLILYMTFAHTLQRSFKPQTQGRSTNPAANVPLGPRAAHRNEQFYRFRTDSELRKSPTMTQLADEIVKNLFCPPGEHTKGADIGNTHTRRHARRGAHKMSAKKVSELTIVRSQ